MFFLYSFRDLRDLHSFPTRRSSDLAATGLRGPCVTVATACSSSAKVFAQAARLIAAGLCDAALVGGIDTLCGSEIFGFNSLQLDRKSTRLNSSHSQISYAVFCLKKK